MGVEGLPEGLAQLVAALPNLGGRGGGVGGGSEMTSLLRIQIHLDELLCSPRQ